MLKEGEQDMTTPQILSKLHEKGMADTYAETSRYFTGTPEDVGESVFESHEMHVESIQLSAAIAMGKLCAEKCQHARYASTQDCEKIILYLICKLEQ